MIKRGVNGVVHKLCQRLAARLQLQLHVLGILDVMAAFAAVWHSGALLVPKLAFASGPMHTTKKRITNGQLNDINSKCALVCSPVRHSLLMLTSCCLV